MYKHNQCEILRRNSVKFSNFEFRYQPNIYGNLILINHRI